MDPTLIARLREVSARVLPGAGVLAAYAYGSRVHGAPHEESDLDVGYYLNRPFAGAALPIREEQALALTLSDAVGCEVDLRNLADAPLELRGRVLEEGVRIFSGNDVARVGLERDLLGRYHDYKDEFRAMHELRLKRIAERGL